MILNKRHMNINRYFFLFIILYMISACSNKASIQETAAFEPDASLREANDLMKKGYYEEAREILDKIRAKDASQKYAVLAKLRIADSYFEDELYEEAAIEYESFLKVHEHHKYAPYAQYKLAMCFFKRIKAADVSYSVTQRALREFQNLQRRYPRNPYMDITESRIKMCERVLVEHEFYVGKFYFDKGSYKAAIGRFEGILEDYPESNRESESLYYMGVSYAGLGQKIKAIDILSSLVEKFPTMELSNHARELIASYKQAPRLIIEK